MRFGLKNIALLIFILLVNCGKPTVNWNPSFDSSDKIPYGTFVLRKELPNIFPNSEIENINKKTQNFIYENGEEYQGGNYMFIYTEPFHDDDTWDDILNFVNHDSGAFIASFNFSENLKNTLGIEIDEIERNTSQEKIKLSVINAKKRENIYEFDNRVETHYFSKINPETTEILGYISYNGIKKPNFIKVYYGTGYFLLHTEPYAFTNYHMLKENRFKYVVDCFSYVDDEIILWDNYRFMYRYDGEEREGGFFSGLEYILKHQSLRWAFYLLILLGFLYLIFNSKRLQQAIPIIKPYKNYNLSFAKTIAILYQNHNDHTALSNYKVNYFLDQVRTNYHLSSFEMENNFAKTLSIKSGVSIMLCQKIEQKINSIKKNQELNKEDFYNLHQLIQIFNQKSGIYGKPR